MCVLIVKKSDGKVTDAQLAACFAANHQGAGFSWVEPGGRVAIHKGFFSFKEFIEAYRKQEAIVGDTSPFLIHFRISTGGGVNTENCHPFRTPHGAMAHNGVLFSVNGPKSDTHVFSERIGPKLSKEGILLHKKALEESIGSGNKIAVLFHDKTYEILNEKQGTWIDGTWFSNCHWQSRQLLGTPAPIVRRVSHGYDDADWGTIDRRQDALFAFGGGPHGNSQRFNGREG